MPNTLTDEQKTDGFKRAPWKLDDGRVLSLITEAELKTLAKGTELFAIDGVRAVVGTDAIDLDTRFGMLAFGFLVADAA